MKLFISLLLISISNFMYSQNCECTEYQKEIFKTPPIDIFQFSSGERLRICPAIRYNFKGDNENYFTDFTIENCENDSLIKYWDNLYCKAKFANDTLTITETVKLPVGKNRKFETLNKSLTKIYFRDKEIIVDNKEISIRKYSPQEIQKVLEEYDSAIKGKRVKAKLLYSSLLLASLSGNDESKKYFLNFDENLRERMSDSELEDYVNLKSAFFPDEQ